MFGEGELYAIYRTNFMVMHNFKWDINWFESLVPYEREIYTAMLMDELEKQKLNRQA